MLDRDHLRLQRETKQLEIERQRVFEYHRAGKYTDIEFIEQKSLLESQLAEKSSLIHKTSLVDTFDLEEALTSCFQFIDRAAKGWLKEDPEIRSWFQQLVFNGKKLSFDGEQFVGAIIDQENIGFGNLGRS